MSNIQAILFDADGVIQRPTIQWREELEKLALNTKDADELISDIFTAEKPCLTGEGNFEEELEKVLEKWKSKSSVDEALKIWVSIETDKEILGLIQELKKKYIVCLATNQQKYRADFMESELGYPELFNHRFYSCYLGKAKPNKGYFTEIQIQLNVKSENILFLDDSPQNADSAKAARLNAEVFNIQDGVNQMKKIFSYYQIEFT